MRNYKKILVILLPAVLFLPSLAFAVSTIFPGFVQCDGVQVKCDFTAAIRTINAIIQWFLNIAISVAAVTFAIAGGKILFNPGNVTKRQEAIEMFKKTVFGLIIVLSAWLVIRTIIKTLVPDPSALQFIE